VSSRVADRLAAAVYIAVAVIALIGQSLAAVHWLGWPLVAALPAVAGVELTAVALAARADYRRRKGEAAIAARLLSATVAAFMTTVNFVGHWSLGQQVAAWFFAGATALGYLVWLLNSADRRRDQMLAEGKVRLAAPDYGVWQWVMRPRVTAHARQLALRDPELGLYGSLDAAVAELQRERRNRAVARALRRLARGNAGRSDARLAQQVYDMDAAAAILMGQADMDGLAALLAERLAPEVLAGHRPPPTPTPRPKVIDGEVAEPSAPTTPDVAEPATERGHDAQVVQLRPAATRPRRTPATRRPSTAATPPVDELVDALCRVHCQERPEPVGAPKAMRTLKRLYGSCSTGRARAAKNGHNVRHGFADGGQVDAGDDDQEGEAA
jgi:hypothetical protein